MAVFNIFRNSRQAKAKLNIKNNFGRITPWSKFLFMYTATVTTAEGRECR